MFFLAIPVILETISTVVVGTIAAKAASDLYDKVTATESNDNDKYTEEN